MDIFENVRLALEGLKSNKMRALLTMLGIIIGIGSVIAIVTVGDSMTSSVTSAMQDMGATNIMVMVRERDEEMGPGTNNSASPAESDLITDDMLDKYTELYASSIEAVSLSSQGGSGKAQDGRSYANVTVTGVSEGYALANNVSITGGRFLREGDVKSNRSVAVVSDKLAANMFGKNADPLGKEIKVNANDSIQTYVIVGVYKYEEGMASLMGGSASDKDLRTNLYIPITTCNMLMSKDEGYQSVTVMAKSGVDTEKFTEDTKRFFNTYYTNNTRWEVNAFSMESMISTMSGVLGTLSIAIAVIAGISLLVGGVGVMNIMLVSVTERTREIGTRKALGAKNTSIRIQFIVEAVIICGIGGIIGVAVGVGSGWLGSSLLGFPGLPSLFIIVVAVLFSMMIGVFFGYYPANKAARLDPIEALRYE